MDTLNLPSGNNYQAPQDDDLIRGEIFGKPPPVLARFYVSAEKDFEETEKQGVPVYREKVMVLLQVTGDRDNMSSTATDEHRERFPREWALFERLRNKPRPIPLDALPKMTPAIKKALEDLKITCVQDVASADLPGYLAQWKPWALKLMNIHEYADKPKPRLKIVDGEMVAA